MAHAGRGRSDANGVKSSAESGPRRGGSLGPRRPDAGRHYLSRADAGCCLSPCKCVSKKRKTAHRSDCSDVRRIAPWRAETPCFPVSARLALPRRAAGLPRARSSRLQNAPKEPAAPSVTSEAALRLLSPPRGSRGHWGWAWGSLMCSSRTPDGSSPSEYLAKGFIRMLSE